MRLALNSLPLETDLANALARAAAVGFDALEVQCHVEVLAGTQARRVVTKSGFACSGGVGIMARGRSLVSPDQYVREYTIAYVSDCLRFVRDVGGSVLTITATEPSAPLESSWEDGKAWCVEALKRCVDVADASGVGLSLEPTNRYRSCFLNRCDQALDIVADLGPSCGVCPDLFHVLTEERDWRTAIHSVGSRLLNLQVAENTRRVPGRGNFDWDGLVMLLVEMDYLGDIVIEMPRDDVLPAEGGGVSRDSVSNREIDDELAFGMDRLRSAIAHSGTNEVEGRASTTAPTVPSTGGTDRRRPPPLRP